MSEPQTARVETLRPTQMTVGMIAVQRRHAKLSARREAGTLAAYLEREPVPCARGPGGALYMVDHHHLVRALDMLGVATCRVSVEHDLTDLAPQHFWAEMEHRGLCYPYDADGMRQPFSAMPGHIRDCGDNPWRSLARFARGGDGFKKTDVPFAEFLWADYFRQFLRPKLLATDWQAAIEVAQRLTRLNAAADLPGYESDGKED